MADVTFRPGRPEDARRLTEYHHRCWVAAFTGLFPPGVVEGLDPWRRLPVFEGWLSSDATDTTVVVAEVTGVAVGHTVVIGSAVAQVFVDPDHWGSGLGRRLLESAERIVAGNGFATAELHTMVGNERALALYRGSGWQVTERFETMEDGDLVWDEHVLLKDLGGSDGA
jgi:GNAT superfamily N-acetyltransferase